jgi:hypothetical protein
MAIIFALEIMGAYHDGLCGNVAWCWCASLNKYKIRFIGCNKNFITKEHLYLYVYIMFWVECNAKHKWTFQVLY